MYNASLIGNERGLLEVITLRVVKYSVARVGYILYRVTCIRLVCKTYPWSDASTIRQKLSLSLLDFNKTWIFSKHFRKTSKYQISCKSFHWQKSCSMRKDGRTWTTKLRVAFRSFAKSVLKPPPKHSVFPTKIRTWTLWIKSRKLTIQTIPLITQK
jgi:hypothetical protein